MEKTNGKSECTGIQETYGLTNGGYYYPNIGYYLKLDSNIEMVIHYMMKLIFY